MSQRDLRLEECATTITLELFEIRGRQGLRAIYEALIDGWQPHDLPVIVNACCHIEAASGEIAALAPEIADVALDIEAAVRGLRLGRQRVFDPRFRARDNDLRRVRAGPDHKKSPTELVAQGASETQSA